MNRRETGGKRGGQRAWHGTPLLSGIPLGLLLFALLVSSTESAESEKLRSWLEEDFLRNAVLIETRVNDTCYAPVGTGFLVYDYAGAGGGVLVTCKHVLQWFLNRGLREMEFAVSADTSLARFYAQRGERVLVVMNKQDESVHEYRVLGGRLIVTVPIADSQRHVVDDVYDIAAFPVNVPSVLFFKGDSIHLAAATHVDTSRLIYAKELELGMDVYYLGFPLNFGKGNGMLSPLVRAGCLAWMSNSRDTLMLDAISWPVNSGSPVFTKPTSSRKASLVGMVYGCLSAPETLVIDGDTCEAAVNFGLAACVPVDRIVVAADSAAKLRYRPALKR